MRLGTFQRKQESEPIAGVILDKRIVPLDIFGDFPTTLLEFIRMGPRAWEKLRNALPQHTERGFDLESVLLLAPLPRPAKNVMCLGWNYSAHADESAQATGQEIELPEHPIVFTKAPTSINAPYGDVPLDRTVTQQLDWEVELGVIIGTAGRNIPIARALEHVFGYTVVNDVTARDLQNRHRQFFLGKSLDGACPLGPWIVTPEEIGDPQALRLRTWINETLKQDGTTAHQIFDVATTIHILSRGMTLEPGDVIATGTPDGVGFARTPPEFLQPGDVVTCKIEGIGTLRNRIVAVG